MLCVIWLRFGVPRTVLGRERIVIVSAEDLHLKLLLYDMTNVRVRRANM